MQWSGSVLAIRASATHASIILTSAGLGCPAMAAYVGVEAKARTFIKAARRANRNRADITPRPFWSQAKSGMNSGLMQASHGAEPLAQFHDIVLRYGDQGFDFAMIDTV